jgi:hypothetical protein
MNSYAGADWVRTNRQYWKNQSDEMSLLGCAVAEVSLGVSEL